MDDGITDEEMLALEAASIATRSAPMTAQQTPPVPPATSFTAAFSSMTSSAHYTSVASMPPPVSTSAGTPVKPVPPPGAAAIMPKPAAHSVLVSPRQRGNPVLNHISNVAYEFGPKELTPDYVCGDSCCALYLSLKYHLLHPNYLSARMQGVGSAFTLRVLLLLVDVDDSERPLLELTQTTFAFGWTLVCCWSVEEVARYLETLRLYEKKTAQAIAERVDDTDHAAKLTEALTEVRSINKTDVRNLSVALGSFAAIAQASTEDLSACMGMGERKVRRLHHVMNQPFITTQMVRKIDGHGGAAIVTPAQAALNHAAAVEKAKAAAAAMPVKKSPIIYLNQLPLPAPAQPAIAPTKGIVAASVAPPVSTVAATVSRVSTNVAVAVQPTFVAPASSASVSVAPTPAAAPSLPYDPNDFIS